MEYCAGNPRKINENLVASSKHPEAHHQVIIVQRKENAINDHETKGHIC